VPSPPPASANGKTECSTGKNSKIAARPYAFSARNNSNLYGRGLKIGRMETEKTEDAIAHLELYLQFLCARKDPGAADMQRTLASLTEERRERQAAANNRGA
jgi:hypothetical protein